MCIHPWGTEPQGLCFYWGFNLLRLESAGELDYEFAVVPKEFFFSFKNAQGEQKKKKKKHLWKKMPVT